MVMERKCVKCDAVLTKCFATSSLGRFAAVKYPNKNFNAKESSELFPYVCSKCGYTEWYVDKPENFDNLS